MTNYRACPICSNDKPELLYDWGRGKKFDTCVCPSCGLVYVANLSHHVGGYRVREDESLSAEKIASVLEAEDRARGMAERRFRNIENEAPHLVSRKGRMHDIGASLGFFMKFWHDAGFEVEGSELDSYYAKIGKEHFGFDISPCLYEERPISANNFDLITICHVLEHISDPRATLRRIRTELKEDGLLYIEVPQIDRPYSGNLDRFFWVEHLNYFSSRTLDGLLRSEGFKVTSCGDLGFFLWMIAEKAHFEDIKGDLPLDTADTVRQRTLISKLHHQDRQIKDLEKRLSKLEEAAAKGDM